jgi:DNA repair exonuclease SbcCD ATPase subunit
VIELQSKRAVECGKAAFAQAISRIKSDSQAANPLILKRQLKDARDLATESFDAAIVDGNPKAKEELELYFATECTALKQRNLDLSLNEAKAAATTFWKTAAQGTASLKEAEKLAALVASSQNMIAHVQQQCVGGNVDHALLQVLSEVSLPQLSSASAQEIQTVLQALAACDSALSAEKSGRAMEKKDAEHAAEVAASKLQTLLSRQEELSAELAREKQAHQAGVSKLEGDLASVKHELKELRDNSQHTIESLRSDLHGMQVQLSQRDAHIHSLESDLRSSKDRCSGLTEQLSESKQTAKELEAKRASERDSADKRIEQMREEMLQQRSEAKINEKSLEEKLHARALDIERMRNDYNNKEIELRSEIKTIQSSLEKARAEAADAVQKAQSDIRNITSEFRGREDKLQSQVLELTEKAAGLKRDLEAARAQTEGLQASLKEAQGPSRRHCPVLCSNSTNNSNRHHSCKIQIL